MTQELIQTTTASAMNNRKEAGRNFMYVLLFRVEGSFLNSKIKSECSFQVSVTRFQFSVSGQLEYAGAAVPRKKRINGDKGVAILISLLFYNFTYHPAAIITGNGNKINTCG